jgi:hypothetical protein
MMTKEEREAKCVLWLEHWRECEAAGESMAAYARRHALNGDEGYRWRQILQRAQRWPAVVDSNGAGASPLVARAAARFARVRIASARHTEAGWPLKLAVLLVNGRRAELMIEDERQLPRVLALLEQPG